MGMLSGIPFWGMGGGSAGGGVSTFMAMFKMIGIGIVIAVPLAATLIFIILLLQERLKVVVVGVNGKVWKLRVRKKNGLRFIKYPGTTELQPYPPDSCILSHKYRMPMCVVRQIGDDFVPYNIREMKMNIGDSRLMRQQHAQISREINAKYDTVNWMAKAAPYFAFALFAVMAIFFLIIGHKTLCG